MTEGSEAELVAAVDRPITTDDVVAALRAVGIGHGETIIVHSSLARLGWVVGGAQSVVEGLEQAVGPTGTIVMPAQTGISDPSTWKNPPVPETWWPIIRQHWPAFDPQATPLRAMGAVVECFARGDATVHSGHPSLGFVARGPKAKAIVGEHRPGGGLGDRSPLGRLYQHDARIVLLGVGHGNNTSLHLAEHRVIKDAAMKTKGAPLMVDGLRQWVTYLEPDYDESDFVELGAAFLAAGGRERRAELGIGEVASYHMRPLVDFGTDWIAENR